LTTQSDLVHPVFDRGHLDHELNDLPAADRYPLRFLVGLDEQATLLDLVTYVGSVGVHGRVVARVVHVIEQTGSPASVSLESVEEASALVDEATFALRMSGVGAEGTVRRGRVDQVADILLQEGSAWHADAIVLAARRNSGVRRLLGRGVREHVLRQSGMATVLVSRQGVRSDRAGRGRRVRWVQH
jgi:nucleotide-binding universal stress UspA family protein